MNTYRVFVCDFIIASSSNDRFHCDHRPGPGEVVCTDTNRIGASPNAIVPPGMNDAVERTSSSAGSDSGAADHRPLPYTPSDVETCAYGK